MNIKTNELGRGDSLRQTWQVISFWGLPAVVATLTVARREIWRGFAQ